MVAKAVATSCSCAALATFRGEPFRRSMVALGSLNPRFHAGRDDTGPNFGRCLSLQAGVDLLVPMHPTILVPM